MSANPSMSRLLRTAAVVALPLALGAFWLGISYLLMVVLWVAGAGELSAFPELILLPGESCWPSTPPC